MTFMQEKMFPKHTQKGVASKSFDKDLQDELGDGKFIKSINKLKRTASNAFQKNILYFIAFGNVEEEASNRERTAPLCAQNCFIQNTTCICSSHTFYFQ